MNMSKLSHPFSSHTAVRKYQIHRFPPLFLTLYIIFTVRTTTNMHNLLIPKTRFHHSLYKQKNDPNHFISRFHFFVGRKHKKPLPLFSLSNFIFRYFHLGCKANNTNPLTHTFDINASFHIDGKKNRFMLAFNFLNSFFLHPYSL